MMAVKDLENTDNVEILDKKLLHGLTHKHLNDDLEDSFGIQQRGGKS